MPCVEQDVDLAAIAPRELIHDPRGDGGLTLLGHQGGCFGPSGGPQLLGECAATRDEFFELDAVKLVEGVV